MTLLNKIMILLSVILFLLCILEPLTRKNEAKGNGIFRTVLKPHAVYGVLLLAVSMIHGILSGNKPGMVSGKIAWLCLLVLLSCSLFKGYRKKAAWLRIHRILAVLFCILILVHIIHVVVL